jgi:hypothetical protein
LIEKDALGVIGGRRRNNIHRAETI